MKGLTLNCLGRKEEAYEHVRKGLRNDLKSHVCWHVYGLLQRSDKKYDEAIKCYRNALKWDPDNIQILRDLSLLQIQMRDLEGYKETRYQLFQLRPTQRASWIGIAMSYHLLADYEKALQILEEFRKTQQKAAYDYEHSELLLYQNMVIDESGDSTAALEHLDRYRDQICDKLALSESRGKHLITNNRLAEAEEIYRDLIKRNPENHLYYNQLAVATGVEFDPLRKLELLQSLKEKYPKVHAPQRLALDVAEGESFRDLVAKYICKALTKGVPPLFVDLRPLYSNPSKVKIIEEICEKLYENLTQHGSYEKDGAPQPPTAILWLYYYLGQHYDYKKDFERAIAIVEKAIEHTPTLIELFVLKGKILKHVGDIETAVACLDEAQSLDTADRYINCKCAKYLLLANRVFDAEEMCQKFTREGVTAMENLNEMQCMWFQTECANAYQRLGKFGESLKKCAEIDRHFSEIIEDQFDFHTYCMRKMTLRSYVDLLRLEDILRSHRFYKKTAYCAINVYLRLHDKPLKDDESLSEINTENMDPSELKKLKNKMKKAKKKAEQEKQSLQQAQARKDMHHKSQRKTDGNEEFDSPAKDDLQPEKLERPDDPLQEALKYLTPLQQLAANSLTTHLLAFEIYYRKGKALLMLQSVKRALKLNVTDPRIHSCLVRFQHFFERNESRMAEPVKEVIKSEGHEIFTYKSAKARNDEFMQNHPDSLDHRVIGAKMLALLEPSKLDNAVKVITQLDEKITDVSLQTCSEVFDLLQSGDLGPCGKNASDTYRATCQTRFPRALKFRIATMKSNNDINKHGHIEDTNKDETFEP